jgi:nickel-dependent lactate racemase
LEFWIPYGDTEVPVRVPDDNFYKILEPSKPSRAVDSALLFSESLERHVGGASLEETVKPGASVGIVIDAMVPPTLRDSAVEQLKARLEKRGAPSTIFIRKRTSRIEAQQQDGVKLLDPAQGSFREAGRTRAGTTVEINEELLSCDAKITLTVCAPHFATGFTGGPEAILPGAASVETIAKNRSLLVRRVDSPPGEAEGNVLSDAVEACKLTGPIFSVCVVPDGYGGADSVLSGELEKTFTEARRRYLELHSPRVDMKADIVVLSAGTVLGMDLYHSVRVLSNAVRALKREGTLILVAECSGGIGDLNFLDYARRFQDRRELVSELRHRFRLGGHVNLHLQDVLENHRVQLVSVLPDFYARNSFRLKTSRTASNSIQQAIRAEGKDAKILIVTRGDLTLPHVGENSDT